MPRPKAELVLTDNERQTLQTWASRLKSTMRLATRARIVLACADGLDNKAVAARLRVCSATVGTWRRQALERRLEGHADEPPPVPPARSPMPTSSGSSPGRSRPSPRTRPTGAPAAWPMPPGCRRRPSAARDSTRIASRRLRRRSPSFTERSSCSDHILRLRPEDAKRSPPPNLWVMVSGWRAPG
jgi:hypothetical protein